MGAGARGPRHDMDSSLCSALIRGASRRARRRVGATRTRFALATVIHACARRRVEQTSNIVSSLFVYKGTHGTRQELGPTARVVRVVRVVASRVAYRSDASRPAAKSANESNLPTSGAFTAAPRREARRRRRLPERGVLPARRGARRRRPRAGAARGGAAGIASSICRRGSPHRRRRSPGPTSCTTS